MKKLIPLFLLVMLVAGCIKFAAPGGTASPIINSFDARPPSISAGESSTLSWNVAGATAVSIDQGIGNVALTGTRAVVPNATTTYTLTATNASGIVTATAQVVLLSPAVPAPTPPAPEPAPPAPPAPPPVLPPAVLPAVSYFTANPAVIPAGNLSTLSWSVSNATSVSIDPGIGPVGSVGTAPVSPAITTTYILTATNAAGWNNAIVNVVVTGAAPPPPPAAPVEHTVTLLSVAAEDGHIEQGGDTNPNPNVGDNTAKKALQAFLSFNISGIPVGATIKSASLDLNTGDVLGDPFAGLGWMRVYNHQYGNLGLEDFTPGFPTGAIYTYSSKPVAAVTSAGLVSALQAKVTAGATRFQLRLQFQQYTDGDAQADALRLGEGKPKIIVTYQD